MLISGVQKFTMLDFPEHTSAIVFTPGCNMRCGYCHNREFVLPEEIKKISCSFIDEKIIFNFLKKRKGLLDGLVISGGEPTLQKDLKSFIEKVRELGFKIKLDTNGANFEVLKDLVESGLLDYVAMDVKTSLSKYNELVGSLINIKDVESSIKFLKESRVPYEFRTTLVKEVHSTEIIEDMKKLLSGSDKYFLQSFRSGNTLEEKFSSYNAFSKGKMIELKNEFSKCIKKVDIR